MLNNPLQLLGMLQNSQNPMGLLQQVYGNNPRFGQIMQIIKGKSPQNINLNQLASQFGLNIPQ